MREISKRYWTIAACMALLLGFIPAAKSEVGRTNQTVSMLIETCELGERTGTDAYVPGGICIGYFAAITDLLKTMEEWTYYPSREICITPYPSSLYILKELVLTELKVVPPRGQCLMS
jgi:hypothetical protein